MRKVGFVASVVMLVGVAETASAAYVDLDWADSVEGWNGNIKNFSGQLMTGETSWWLTGLPDSDQNGNGYAWDSVDNDYVAGWKMPFANDSFTVFFDTPIQDGEGDDLLVVAYRGSTCLASVQASSDGEKFTELGTIGGGSPGYLEDFWFDLGGLSDVQYVRVERVNSVMYSAAFVDAIGAVPEPASGLLIVVGGVIAMVGRRQKR